MSYTLALVATLVIASPEVPSAGTWLATTGSFSEDDSRHPVWGEHQPSEAALQTSGGELPPVRVVHADARQRVDGQLIELGRETVRILVGGTERELRLVDVRRIEVKRADSLRNGAAAGAIVVAAWCAAVCGQGTGAAMLGPAIAVNAALGAVLGAGLDALRRQKVTIYPHSQVSAVAHRRRRVSLVYRVGF